MSEAYGSPEQVPNKQITAQLYLTLEQALQGCEGEVGQYHGWQLFNVEQLDLGFVPPGKKIKVRNTNGDTEDKPRLYYPKAEAYDPEAFLMPSSELEPNRTYEVSGVAQVVDEDPRHNLLLEVRLNGTLFYTNSIADLEFEVVDKTNGEKVNELLRKNSQRLTKHDLLVRKAEELQSIRELVESLPEFDLVSSDRYTVDLFYGGRLYAIDSGQQEAALLNEFRIGSNIVHGKFAGNKIKVIDNKLLLVDEENGIGFGAIDDKESDRALGGFANLGINSVAEKTMNQDLLLAYLQKVQDS